MKICSLLKKKADFFCRSGFVVFVVLGGVFVLALLVMGYNFFVRGKFGESKEVLRHTKAFKIGQSLNNYLVASLKVDLRDPKTGLKEKFAKTNDPDSLAKSIQDWVLRVKNDTEPLLGKLAAPIRKQECSVEFAIRFANIRGLNQFAKKGVHYLGCEKSGEMTVEVDVHIGKAREVFSQTFPFKLISTVPIPLGKFTLFVSEGNKGTDYYKFNTVAMDLSGRPVANSPFPIMLYHGQLSAGANKKPGVWKKRGWVYLGGKRLVLNRAGGVADFGQRFHSYYPQGLMPIALKMNFNNYSPVNDSIQNFVFKSARWGFFQELMQSSGIWKKILKDDFSCFPETSGQYWFSSCLHLFGKGRMQDASQNRRSITRVMGDVEDRFIDLVYLVTDPPNGGPLGAVIGLDKTTYEKNSAKTGLIKSTSPDKLIEVSQPVAKILNVADLDFMKNFFKALPYDFDRANPGKITFESIMSRSRSCRYDETYNQVAQYELNNNNLDIPPQGDVPPTTDMDFQFPKFFDGSEFKGSKVPDAAAIFDAGMGQRVCYELTAANVGGDPKQSLESRLMKALKESFFVPGNNNSLAFQDAVVRVVTKGQAKVSLDDNLYVQSGGVLMVDGPIEVGTFRNVAQQSDVSLAIVAEMGPITLKSGKAPTRAHLIALGPNGELKSADKKAPLFIFGALAVKNFSPAEFTGGGAIWFDENLDPTTPASLKHLSLVIGPSGAL